MVLSRSLKLGVVLLILASVFASACSIVDKKKSDGDSSGSSSVKVTQGVFASQLDQNNAPINPSYAFPAGTKQINAVLLLDGAKPDTKITAHWYQLNVKDAPPLGAEVNSAVSTIKKEDINDKGQAVVRFSQASNNGLPVDSWSLRVFAGSTLIRTMGFVIVNTNQGAAPPPAPNPPAATAPSGTPGNFTNYTVVSGDTVSSLATKFKPATEDIAAFTTRFAQANNISATATLTPGQVLRVPR